MEEDRDRIPAPIQAILEREGLDPRFSEAVMAEAAALVAEPGLDDPALEDQEHIPYVTVDGEHTRDLDQALYLERDGRDGYRILYAIADAAHYVRPGTALFAEALARGTSVYLPGLSVPMLPRSLSEGAVSLNPGVPRRALVFDMRVDASGVCTGTTMRRARIRSRAKLSFEAVQTLLDAPKVSPLAGAEFAKSLALLPVVGKLRQLEAAARQVIRFHREEVSVGLNGDAFTVIARVRHDVEKYNEQLSLLCNAEGGRVLCAAVGDDTSYAAQAIYRVHPAPPPERLVELEAQLAELAALHGLDAGWQWHPERSLAEWVEALPALATDARLQRIARAVERQAVMVNVRSVFSAEPGQHYGVGVEPYARFSAPMREIVGCFVHKEAVETLGMAPRRPAAEDATLRDQVMAAANDARERQRRLTDLTNRRVLDQIFAPDLAVPRAARPARAGVIMGVNSSKIYVTLDDPPVDVKLYAADAGRALGGVWLSLTPGKSALAGPDGAPLFTVGDAIALRLVRRDEARDRWVFEPIISPRSS